MGILGVYIILTSYTGIVDVYIILTSYTGIVDVLVSDFRFHTRMTLSLPPLQSIHYITLEDSSSNTYKGPLFNILTGMGDGIALRPG